MKNIHFEENRHIATKISFGVIFLVIGCMIYLLFRSKSLNIYQWCSYLALSDIIDSLRESLRIIEPYDWIRYSLPDGLYCASYLLIIDAIWHHEKGKVKILVLSIVPFVTIGSEILQFFGIVKGTFDIVDLLFYVMPVLIYMTVNIINNNFKTLEL